jgi:hypothetical protein
MFFPDDGADFLHSQSMLYFLLASAFFSRVRRYDDLFSEVAEGNQAIDQQNLHFQHFGLLSCAKKGYVRGGSSGAKQGVPKFL